MISSIQPPPIYQPPPLIPPASPRKADARWAFPPSVFRFVDTHYGTDALALPLGGIFKLMNKIQFKFKTEDGRRVVRFAKSGKCALG